jgi:hypothetical protein
VRRGRRVALAWQGWGEYARLHRLIQLVLAGLAARAVQWRHE